MQIIDINDFIGLLELNVSESNKNKVDAAIIKEQQKQLFATIDAQTAQNIIDTDTLTEKQTALLYGEMFTDDYGKKHKFAGISDYLIACIACKIIGYPEIKDTKPVGYNSENSSQLSAKQTAIALYNDSACGIIEYYQDWLDTYKNREIKILLSTPVVGGYDLTLETTKFLEVGDKITINSTDFVISAIDNLVITIETNIAGFVFSDKLIHNAFDEYEHSISMII